MDCREAQSLIVPFIEGTLSDEQNEKFIEHIERCGDCYDELEVYYIVMVGVKQLDEEEHMLVDFNGDLKKYIAFKKEQLAKKHSRSARLRFGCAVAFLLLLFTGSFAYYNIYTHPDLAARYIRQASQAIHLDIHVPAGEKHTLITRKADDYFVNNAFDMPLRRIQAQNSEEGADK